jgi:hypothetical protein
LNDEKSKRKITDWFPGNHGVKNQSYTGEANGYGPEVWKYTYEDWTSGSELALAIVKFDSQQRLTKPREFHWERRAHLFSNELFLREALVCLRQAYLYQSPQDVADPQISSILQAIDQLLNHP